LRDPSKDLSSVPEVMEGKRVRKTTNYLGGARKGDNGESDADDSQPIGQRRKDTKGGDSESDSEDSMPIGKRRKV
jgi:hypothetical protein